MAGPASFVNALLTYIQNHIALLYRQSLTKQLQQHLMRAKLYYQLQALDDRIQDPDQLMAVDVNRFSHSLAALYANLGKPVLDVLVYNTQLVRQVGFDGLLGLTFVVQLSAAALRKVTPPLGQYVAEEARLEGQYRSAHAKTIDYAEEIALTKGYGTERDMIEFKFLQLASHLKKVMCVKFSHQMCEEGVVKWLWGALGLMVCAIPVTSNASIGVATENLIINRRLLLSSSDAFSRIIEAYKDIAELAGYTDRLASLFDAMHDISNGHTSKQISATGSNDILKMTGTIQQGSDIIFKDVPIVSPNGDVLIPKLSFHITQGQHLLVVGPNGCGKSSLFRILGGLWDTHGGSITKPPPSAFLFLPQRPYVCIGTLRDQILYPTLKDSFDPAQDAELQKMLHIVGLDHILNFGWDARRDWANTLSMGDLQRLGMVRLFYHKPQYAILDESTSSTSAQVEQAFYQHASALGITLLTVSHRESIWKYHKSILQFTGDGQYIFKRLDVDQHLRLTRQKAELEALIAKKPVLEQRLQDLSAPRKASQLTT